MSCAAGTRRPSKLLGQINFPFVASLVLNDDHAEVLLYIVLGPNGSSSSTPQATLKIALRYPYQSFLGDSKKPTRESASTPNDNGLGAPSEYHRFLLENLQRAAVKLADSHSQVAPSPAATAQAANVVVGDSQLPTAHQASVDKVKPFLTLAGPQQFEVDDEPAIIALLEEANAGVNFYAPELVAEGEGGTYFVFDSTGSTIGVFKPTDEDPQADNNPKRKASNAGEDQPAQRTRQSIPANETAIREAAAYAIDCGYAGVPPTFLVEAKHSSFGDEGKLGSLQQFVTNECASWDVGPASFSVEDVHRIGLFDIRTFNTDRHGGNLLCKKAAQPRGKVQYDLVPIDHAYCFPTDLGEANWEWLYWPQAKVPFSEEELRHVDSIDVDADAALLARLGLSPKAVRVYRITTTLLKRGAAAGLTLFELGKLCYRGRNNALSPLEAALSFDLDAERDDYSNDPDFDDRVASALEQLFAQSRDERTRVSRG